MLIGSPQATIIIFHGNSNVFPILDYFRDMHNRNVCNFNLDLYRMGQGQIEIDMRLHNLMAVVMFTLSVIILDIFAVEMCTVLAVTFRMDQGQM